MSPAEKLSKSKPRRKFAKPATRKVVCLVAERRHALGLTLDDVSANVKLSKAGLHAIEHGGDVQMTSAFKLAAFFGCKVDDLWSPLRPTVE